MNQWKVNEKKNWKRPSTGEVFTGKQINNLLALANPTMRAIILLEITETTDAPTDATSRFGPAEKA